MRLQWLGSYRDDQPVKAPEIKARKFGLLCQLLDLVSHPYGHTIHARKIHDHEDASGGKDVARTRTTPYLTLTGLMAQSHCLQMLLERIELTTYLLGYEENAADGENMPTQWMCGGANLTTPTPSRSQSHSDKENRLAYLCRLQTDKIYQQVRYRLVTKFLTISP
ncbi:hypothetical protein BDV38DRAFT_285675 [Aspergillus pseudotamarii]|uniref:Uncharacterized protein n=1 Tax=Aspergillus pseudotamarii TaxID=132259 RepID=A0A5N6SKY7_ASPPS|nr:uncharacterized protein BDV38DRAFT_285675 [Aspergillus pseudotamarii]KAE8134557.1 hypothetical protein BDV38DRAFT_285675 [Aspergillus pseudotamarii]